MYESPAIIAEVGQLLREPITKDNIIKLEKLRYDLASKTTEWLILLYEKRAQYLWPKEKDITELDRKIRLDANTGIIEADYRLLKEIALIVQDRIDLAKILLLEK